MSKGFDKLQELEAERIRIEGKFVNRHVELLLGFVTGLVVCNTLYGVLAILFLK